MSLDPELALRLLAALAIGAVVGLERGFHARDEASGLRVAGLRSFVVVALLGGVASLLAEAQGGLVLAAALLALAVLAATAYALEARRDGDRGLTTELALLTTFALAALALQGWVMEALAGAVAMAVILRAKAPLHAGLAWLDPAEVRAMLQVAVLAAVALPLLPDRALGPWDAVDPRTIGWLVLLIAGLQVVGYLAMRRFGTRRGVLLTALLGGLSSSTAVTLAFARMAARRPGDAPVLAAGVALACATMGPRLLVEVAAVERSLLPDLVLPLAALALVPVAAAGWIAWRGGIVPEEGAVALRNPLELSQVLGWAVLLTGLALAVGAARALLGHPGVYGVAALAGLADVDAIALSLARAAGGDLDGEVAARAVGVAAVVNTLVKAGLAAAVGGRAFAGRVVAILAAAAGGAGLLLLAGVGL